MADLEFGPYLRVHFVHPHVVEVLLLVVPSAYQVHAVEADQGQRVRSASWRTVLHIVMNTAYSFPSLTARSRSNLLRYLLPEEIRTNSRESNTYVKIPPGKFVC